jgi:DNA-binding XRE family transcriptional regulator
MTENIVKKTCKELGITQKELAELIGVSEDTVSLWSTGKVQMPNIAIKCLELLKVEKKFNSLKQIISDELTK